ncbi:MAG: methyltransferase [Motiliproteus sp.]
MNTMDIDQPDKILRKQIGGYQNTALIFTAVKLGLPDLLQEEKYNLQQLAEKIQCAEDKLKRLLSALELIGLCYLSTTKIYQLTESGRLLATNSSTPHREMVEIAVEQYWESWTNLSGAIRTGKSAFERLHGQNVFEWRSENADANEKFNLWLSKETKAYISDILEVLDLTGTAEIADIGGGSGILLGSLLRKHPHIRGKLFDQPHVIQQTKNAIGAGNQDIQQRLEYIEGDFFKSVPVKADTYIMKSIIHDWDDVESIAILRNCYSAIPKHSRFILIERLTKQEAKACENTILLDMHMMAVTGGKERSLDEYKYLLLESNFNFIKSTVTSSGFHLIEAVPA